MSEKSVLISEVNQKLLEKIVETENWEAAMLFVKSLLEVIGGNQDQS